MTFEQEIAAEDLQARREAVEAIRPLYEWREQRRMSEAGEKNYDPSASDYTKMGALRRWLLEHEGERLHDDESGLVAYLSPRSGATHYASTLELREKAPELLDKLLLLGCLSVDDKRVRDAMQRGELTKDELASWSHPTDGTPSLRIEKA